MDEIFVESALGTYNCGSFDEDLPTVSTLLQYSLEQFNELMAALDRGKTFVTPDTMVDGASVLKESRSTDTLNPVVN